MLSFGTSAKERFIIVILSSGDELQVFQGSLSICEAEADAVSHPVDPWNVDRAHVS